MDISPIQSSPSLHSMGYLFDALQNVQVPTELTLGNGRQFAGDQIKHIISHDITRNFILMNLVKDPVDGRYENTFFLMN